MQQQAVCAPCCLRQPNSQCISRVYLRPRGAPETLLCALENPRIELPELINPQFGSGRRQTGGNRSYLSLDIRKLDILTKKRKIKYSHNHSEKAYLPQIDTFSMQHGAEPIQTVVDGAGGRGVLSLSTIDILAHVHCRMCSSSPGLYSQMSLSPFPPV